MKKWLFYTYHEEVTNANSAYASAVKQWDGAHRAVDLASAQNASAENFWPEIEEVWQRLKRV